MTHPLVKICCIASVAEAKAIRRNSSFSMVSSAGRRSSASPNQPDWAKPQPTITTPFVKVPGLIATKCVQKGDYHFLEMTVTPDPATRLIWS